MFTKLNTKVSFMLLSFSLSFLLPVVIAAASQMSREQTVYILQGKGSFEQVKAFKGLGLNYSSGKASSYLAPIATATLIKTRPTISNSGLVLRDNKVYIALVKFDYSKIGSFDEVVFSFRPVYIEGSGKMKISFHRILTSWDSTATWNKPKKSAKGWAGMKSGQDFEAAAFVTYSRAYPSKTPFFVKGFGHAVKKWQTGEWANNGFVMLISGKVIQVNFSSATHIKVKKNKKHQSSTTVVLGGVAESKYAFTLNTDIAKAILLNKDDLLAAYFNLEVLKIDNTDKEALLNFNLVKSAWNMQATQLNVSKQPFLSVPLSKLKVGSNRLEGFTRILKKWLYEKKDNYGISLSIKSSDKTTALLIAPPTYVYRNNRAYSRFVMQFKPYPNEFLFSQAIKPTEGIYTKRKGSKLFYGGKRLRLWGANRHGTANLFIAERIKKMGFNAVRLWGPGSGLGWYTANSSRVGKVATAAESKAVDRFDRFFAEVKKQGMFVMFPSLHYYSFDKPAIRKALFNDNSFLAGSDKKDWAAWKNAIKLCKKTGIRSAFLKYFDKRVKKYTYNHALEILRHKNKYTGKTYAAEEAIFLYEIDNENGFLQWMLVAEKAKKLPAYFMNELQGHWNNWLKKRYQSDADILKSWGSVKPKETLRKVTYALAPYPKEAANYPAQRANDFVEFMTSLVVNYNSELIKKCRSMAPKGIGVNVVPFMNDTQFIKNVNWLYANVKGGDVNSFGTYSFTLSSALTVPPRMYVLDHLTVKNKPTILYEVNVGRPNPYRGEFPYRVAAFAARQDWDGVFWHYITEPRGNGHVALEEPYTHEEFLVTAQLYPTGVSSTHLNGINDRADPIKYSALAMASQLFRSGIIPPRKSKRTYSIGPAGYLSYKFMRGLPALNGEVAFSEGTEITFEPNQKAALIVSEGLTVADKKKQQIINWDWENGRMIVDLDSIKMYIGKPVPKYTFKDGIVLSGINTPFVTFCLMTADKSPILAASPSTKIFLTVLADSQNTNFKIDLKNIPQGGAHMHPNEQGKRIINFGRAPAIIEQVSFGLSFPKKLNAVLNGYDYALRKVKSYYLQDKNTLAFPKGQNYFLNVLQVNYWGENSKTQVVKSEIKRQQVNEKVSGKKVKRNLSFWNPLKGVTWNTSYTWVHQIIRDGSLPFSSISKFKTSNDLNNNISITDYPILGISADLSIFFGFFALIRTYARLRRL